MFDRVAPRYDLANTVFSMGQDKTWRVAAARATGLAEGEVAVDVACGTGALARDLEELAPGALVVGMDFSQEMLKRAGPPADVFQLGAGAQRAVPVLGRFLLRGGELGTEDRKSVV